MKKKLYTAWVTATSILLLVIKDIFPTVTTIDNY